MVIKLLLHFSYKILEYFYNLNLIKHNLESIKFKKLKMMLYLILIIIIKDIL